MTNPQFRSLEEKIRYNKEYFGYIVGFPDGDIVLASPEAGELLAQGATLPELENYLLEKLEVIPNFHLNTPPLVWIELTRRCNLTCPHCYIEGGAPRQNEMSTAELYSLIDELAEMGVWAVAFTGGEPALHPAFVELVNYAREKNLLVGIATNGMFLNDRVLDSLRKDGVIISVSLDDLHIMGSNPGSDFNVATRAILKSQERGFLTNIMTNTHRNNISHLKELMDWAEAHQVSVRSVPFSPLGRGKKHRYLENTPEDVETAAQFWLRECEWEHQYHRSAGLCVGSIFNYGLSLGFMTRRCSSGRFLCYVCADGTVYPCTMCAGEKILSPGNIRDNGFINLWRSEWEVRRYNWDNFQEACNGCVINSSKYYCASRCPAMSHARNNHYFGCGASEFEILSTIRRTQLLERTEVGQSSGIPLVLQTSESLTNEKLKDTDGVNFTLDGFPEYL
jgi:radical SAM protein with 4Fe4S-binding SPASM domain